MPLHGKIVVIKRSGGDGTEFPLTATCLFGRKPDCDIRIQLPQVSKEHCRIDLNENKEVILTNLSSVNPTRVNGEVLQQSERLKHGDLITIIDRSFRFEYPPAPTPKKRSSTGGKVLQDQQVGETVTDETDEKRISQVCTDLHLKDGANHDNIQRCLEKTVEVESKEDGSLLQNKTTSPFSDLYQMIKKSLDVNTPLKSSASLLQTPTSRFCTPKPGSVMKNVVQSVSTKDKSTPKKAEVKDFTGSDESKGQADSLVNRTPNIVKKQRRSFQVSTAEMAGPTAEKDETLLQKRKSATPQTFTVSEVIEQIAVQKSPARRRSKEATPAKLVVTLEQEKQAVTAPTTDHLQNASPMTSGNVEKVKGMSRKRKSGELAADLPKSQMKKKRVSFGGYLSPELFDKRLPPDSPLCKGATPRRSLCLVKPRLSLLRRRASVIGNLKECKDNSLDLQSLAKLRTPSPKKSSNAKNASPKTPTPGKKPPKSKTPSPKAASPAKKSPKSKTPSPKAASPARKSPKSKTPSPKAASPARKSPKSKTPSPKAASPAKKSPKSKTPSPKAASPARKSPKAEMLSSSISIKTKTPTGRRSSSMVVPPLAHQENYPIVVLTPFKTGLNSGVRTPTVQGRFSVSRIITPSPVAEEAVSNQVPSIPVTPKIPLRRTSMKSASRKTPSVAKSAVKGVLRKSGISRASMKAMNSWADIVKFGKTKTRVAPAAKILVAKKPLKKAMPKPRTPARKVIDHVSTGHADSPVTIVVGQAYKKRIVHSAGAAPRVVTNTALYKKDMKMDEDLTGLSEMFKTPVNERKRRSVINDSSITKTPTGRLGISVLEPSVLTTPEEPGEMMVSPLSVESPVKRRQYNNEAVQRLLNVNQEPSIVNDVPALAIRSDSSQQQSTTPKQKPVLQECLTGVKRIMKTPRQKAEPVEDLRGKLLKTPKEKAEPQECLTGVKRIMRTPKEKSAPVEDMVGVKRLFKTPTEKGRPVEYNFGIKRLMKSPRLRGNAPVEDFEGLQKLLEEPQTESTRHMETNEVEDKAQLDCGVKVAQEKDVPKEPQDNVPAVDMPKVFKSCMEEEPSGSNESLNAIETISQAVMDGDLHLEKVKVQTDMNLSEDQPEVEITTTDVLAVSTSNEYSKKSAGSKRAKSAQPKAAEDKPEATEHSEELVIPAPVRGRRREKTETTAPPTVRRPTRSRSIKNTRLTVEESNPQPSKAAVRPKRGRNVTKVLEDQAAVLQAPTKTETAPEAESEQGSQADVEPEPNNCASSLQKNLSKPKEGRKTKQVSEESQSVPKVHPSDMTEDATEVHSDQQEVASNGNDEVKEAAPQGPVTESLSEVDTASGEETDVPVIQKRPVRGRRAKIVESKAAEKKQEAKPAEESALPALVRGKRGNKREATAPSAPRQTANKRNAKSLENTLETLVTENSAEAIDDQTFATDTSQEENCPAVEAVMKPKGRKTKTLVEPKKNEAVSDQQLVADAQPEQLINTVAKPRRGRKTKPDTVEQVAEDAVVTKQQTQPARRAKRGRNAEMEEENPDNDGKTETTKLEEPVKKLRRTRKADPDNVEPKKEEIQSAEMVVDKAEASLVEPKMTNEQPAVAIKPRRGGRKTKQDTESETPVESMEIQEVPAVCPTEKPKRGRRGKQVIEESEITTEASEGNMEQKLEVEDKKDSDSNASVVKSSRARLVKTEVSQAIPCKRARRGAALPIDGSNGESTVPDSEPALRSGPAKRGRRAAAKATDGVNVSSDLAHPPEDVSSAAVEDSKMSKRSVRWKANVEVFEIPKAKTGRAVGGRGSKLADQAKGESNNVSKDADKSEEEGLSDKKAEALPVKRARRGAKVTDQAESLNKLEDAEAETQPKVRRGRSAKK